MRAGKCLSLSSHQVWRPVFNPSDGHIGKERTKSRRLSSDLHVCALWHGVPHINKYRADTEYKELQHAQGPSVEARD